MWSVHFPTPFLPCRYIGTYIGTWILLHSELISEVIVAIATSIRNTEVFFVEFAAPRLTTAATIAAQLPWAAINLCRSLD